MHKNFNVVKKISLCFLLLFCVLGTLMYIKYENDYDGHRKTELIIRIRRLVGEFFVDEDAATKENSEFSVIRMPPSTIYFMDTKFCDTEMEIGLIDDDSGIIENRFFFGIDSVNANIYILNNHGFERFVDCEQFEYSMRHDVLMRILKETESLGKWSEIGARKK